MCAAFYALQKHIHLHYLTGLSWNLWKLSIAVSHFTKKGTGLQRHEWLTDVHKLRLSSDIAFPLHLFYSTNTVFAPLKTTLSAWYKIACKNRFLTPYRNSQSKIINKKDATSMFNTICICLGVDTDFICVWLFKWILPFVGSKIKSYGLYIGEKIERSWRIIFWSDSWFTHSTVIHS